MRLTWGPTGCQMPVTKPLFVCLACVCALIPGAGGVRAQALVSARVISSEGEVEIRRRSEDQPRVQKISFKADEELRAGDTVITGRGGRLILGLSDGSQAVIAPQTTVVIQDLGHSPRTLFNLIRGKTRVRIEKLGGEPNPYRVNTPTAVIAVRGTIFDVLVEEEETQVFLHEGEVEVTNSLLPGRPVFLFAGQTTRVLMRQLPDRPGKFSIGRNDELFRGGGRIGAGGTPPEFGRGGPATPDGRGKGPAVRPELGHGSSGPNAGPKGGRRP